MQRLGKFGKQGASDWDFAYYLRTGRIALRGDRAGPVEVKFNPWHDPENGRFTFVGQGRYYGSVAGQRRSDGGFKGGGGGSFGGGGATARDIWPSRQRERRQPDSRPQIAAYTVARGDSLASIAARQRVSVADIVRVNRLDSSRPLIIGQRLNIIRATGPNLSQPPKSQGPVRPPPLLPQNTPIRPAVNRHPTPAQTRTAERGTVMANGYRFEIDGWPRTVKVEGELAREQSPRSRRLQIQAGGADRRPTDDGGHYIAVRFNGPRIAANHFPQDSGINRGTYRAIEDDWSSHLRQGRKVFVRIVPNYIGTSLRPDSLDVNWYVDGQRFYRTIANQRRKP